MQFTRRNIQKTSRNGIFIATSIVSATSSNNNTTVSGNYLPALNNGDGTYTVDLTNVLFTGSIVAEGEVSAYGAGESGGTSSGSVTIYDGLDSSAIDVALSANQGRVLKDMIKNVTVDLSDYYTSSEVDTLISDYAKYDHSHSIAQIGSLETTLNSKANSSDLTNHIADTTAHITSTDRTNWNTAYNNRHTHSNKTVLDGITSTKVSNWDTVYSNWNNVFEIKDNGDLRVKVNVIGDAEISAYGAGTSTGAGGVDIVDALTSTRTDAALSANQGRLLKSLIDNIDVSNIDLSDYYTKTQVDDLIDDVNPTWSNISGKPTFSTVATSGSYSDLSNKPTIPTNNNQLTNGAGYITGITKSMVTTALGYTPPTTNTTYSASTGLSLSTSNAFSVKYGTAAGTACQGNDSRLSDSRPASDVYSWAKASSKPSYSWSEITSKPTSMPASDVYSWAKASSKPSYSWSEITSKPTFATVATSGKYSDLSGKPTIPTNNNQLTNGAGYITSSASISGNAGSATKLATARTLWGQSFNGTANVSGNMTGVGSISCTSVTATGEVTAHSDKRLKDNIQPLEIRGELNPVTYEKDGKQSIGFIADEVKALYPELVTVDESTDEKYLSLNYQQLTAVLYAEIKELKNQIRELNEKVRTMAN